MMSLFILNLCPLGHKAVEQGIINLANYASGDLLTIFDHHSSFHDSWPSPIDIIRISSEISTHKIEIILFVVYSLLYCSVVLISLNLNL